MLAYPRAVVMLTQEAFEDGLEEVTHGFDVRYDRKRRVKEDAKVWSE